MAVVSKAIRSLSLEEAKFANEILAIEEGIYEEEDAGEVIREWTATFEDGYFADIKLVNGDTPYVDSVLFNPAGVQVDVLDVSEEPIGSFLFVTRDAVYTVSVQVPDTEWNRTIPEDKMGQYLISKGYDLGQHVAPEFLVDSTRTFDCASQEGWDWVQTREDYYLFFPKRN